MRPITAADLMNPEVLSVPDDMTLSDLAAFLLDNEITGAPVADRRGRRCSACQSTRPWYAR
jgi:predicted transcriptional regulator